MISPQWGASIPAEGTNKCSHYLEVSIGTEGTYLSPLRGAAISEIELVRGPPPRRVLALTQKRGAVKVSVSNVDPCGVCDRRLFPSLYLRQSGPSPYVLPGRRLCTYLA